MKSPKPSLDEAIDLSDIAPILPIEKTGKVDVVVQVNVRSDPSMGPGNVIGVLPNGADVVIDDEENGFYHVRSGKIAGYCDKRYINLTW